MIQLEDYISTILDVEGMEWERYYYCNGCVKQYVVIGRMDVNTFFCETITVRILFFFKMFYEIRRYKFLLEYGH